MCVCVCVRERESRADVVAARSLAAARESPVVPLYKTYSAHTRFLKRSIERCGPMCTCVCMYVCIPSTYVYSVL